MYPTAVRAVVLAESPGYRNASCSVPSTYYVPLWTRLSFHMFVRIMFVPRVLVVPHVYIINVSVRISPPFRFFVLDFSIPPPLSRPKRKTAASIVCFFFCTLDLATIYSRVSVIGILEIVDCLSCHAVYVIPPNLCFFLCFCHCSHCLTGLSPTNQAFV